MLLTVTQKCARQVLASAVVYFEWVCLRSNFQKNFHKVCFSTPWSGSVYTCRLCINYSPSSGWYAGQTLGEFMFLGNNVVMILINTSVWRNSRATQRGSVKQEKFSKICLLIIVNFFFLFMFAPLGYVFTALKSLWVKLHTYAVFSSVFFSLLNRIPCYIFIKCYLQKLDLTAFSHPEWQAENIKE